MDLSKDDEEFWHSKEISFFDFDKNEVSWDNLCRETAKI